MKIWRKFWIVLFLILLFLAVFWPFYWKDIEPQVLSFYEDVKNTVVGVDKKAVTTEKQPGRPEKSEKVAKDNKSAEQKSDQTGSLKEKADKKKADQKQAELKKTELKKPVFEGTDIKLGGSKLMGFAPPGWEVQLKLGSKLIGRSPSNTKDGRWVILPEKKLLPNRKYTLRLEAVSPDKKERITSDQAIEIMMPEKKLSQAKVTLLQKGKEPLELQKGDLSKKQVKPEVKKQPEKPKPLKSTKTEEQKVKTQKQVKTEKTAKNQPEKKVVSKDKPQKQEQRPFNADLLSFGKVHYKQGGTSLKPSIRDSGVLAVTGKALPNSTVNLYIDKKRVGSVKTDKKGNWSYKKKGELTNKAHKLRVEQLGKDKKVLGIKEHTFKLVLPATTKKVDKEKPVSKAEKPVKADMAKANPTDNSAKKSDKKEKVKPKPKRVVKERPAWVIVVVGDTLWGIAVRFYGDGFYYKKIYTRNRDKIEDPDLIYPGQKFILP